MKVSLGAAFRRIRDVSYAAGYAAGWDAASTAAAPVSCTCDPTECLADGTGGHCRTRNCPHCLGLLRAVQDGADRAWAVLNQQRGATP